MQPLDGTILGTKERLLNGGVAYLTTHGYYGSGLKGILDTAGIPKGSFYHYFESKDVFTAAVIDHYIEPYLEKLKILLAHPGANGQAILLQYFSELIEDATASGFSGGCLLGNLMGEIDATRNPATGQALREAMAAYAGMIKTVILRGQADGSLRDDLQASDLSNLLVNQWQGALLRAKLESSDRPLKDCVSSLVMGYFQPAALKCLIKTL